jgi:hypothetical protein
MNRQKSLFGDPVPVETSDLIIRGRTTRPLTKAQQTFNRLLARIDNLRKKLELETRRLNDALSYHSAHVIPRQAKAAQLRVEIVRSLFPFLLDKRLKRKGDRNALRRLLAQQIAMVADVEDVLPEDLSEIFRQVQGCSFEEFEEQATTAILQETENMWREMGVNVDLSRLRDVVNREDELEGKVTEIIGELERKIGENFEAFPAARKPRKKSRSDARRAEKERLLAQAEEARKKTLASIYKQLARVLHPDLEQDPAVRESKVLLMQRLTVAYRNNDLHTLLRLEMEWIERQEGDLERLADEKLSVYNHVLKEQVDELQIEIDQLPLHPRYAAMTQGDFFFDFEDSGPELVRELDEQLTSMRRSIDRFRSEEGWDEVQSLLRELRNSHRR